MERGGDMGGELGNYDFLRLMELRVLGWSCLYEVIVK